MIEPLTRILLLLRFLCFIALFYLALHAIVIKLTAKSDSKLIWFFSLVTDPLIRPVRSRLRRDASPLHVIFVAMLVYGALWICLLIVGMLLK